MKDMKKASAGLTMKGVKKSCSWINHEGHEEKVQQGLTTKDMKKSCGRGQPRRT
jgi:hypothetical protein